MGDIVVFTGNSNNELVDNICKEIGIEKGKCKVSTFSMVKLLLIYIYL